MVNKNKGSSPERATCFKAPDFTALYARSHELAERTRAVTKEMENQTRRMHDAIALSDRLLNEQRRRPQR
jgi:hypothetical protein